MFHPEISPEENERLSESLWIGNDLDDFIFDLAEPSLAVLNERYETNYKKEDIDEYWYIRAFLEENDVPEDDILAFHKELYFPPNIHQVYEKSLADPEAVEFINGVYRAGHKPFFLTSRPPGTEDITEKQLKEAGIDWVNGDWADGGNILIRDQYYWDRIPDGDEFKLRVIRGNFTDGKYKDFPGLDVHFDDMGILLDHPLAVGIEDRIFIIYRKYNEGVPREKLLYNWQAFNGVVLRLSQNRSLDWPNVVQ